MSTLPISCIGIVLVSFLFGMIGLLNFSIYLICIISYILLFISLGLYIKSKTLFAQIKHIFSPPFIIWIILIIAICFFHDGRLLIEWDEFSHWGDAVKTMYVINDFYSARNSLSAFQTYLPGISLFELYFEVIGCIEFNESVLYISYDIFSFTLTLSLLRNLKWSNIKQNALKLILILIIIISCPLMFYSNFYSSIMVDAFLSTIFAYSLINLYINKEYNVLAIFNISISLCMLTLTKDIGIVFSAIIIFASILDITFVKNNWSHIKNNFVKTYTPIFIFIATTILIYLLWQINIIINDSTSPFSENSMSIKDALFAMFNIGDSYLLTVRSRYLHALFEEPITASTFISFNMVATCMIIISIIILTTFFIKKNNRKKYIIIFLTSLIGLCVYIALMLFLYMIKFSQYEALALASYPRYMSIYAYALLLMIVYVCYYEINRKLMWIPLLYVSLICLILSPIQNIINSYDKSHAQNIRKSYENTSFIHEYFGKERIKIWMISQGDNGASYQVVKYLIKPNLSGINGFGTERSWSLGQPYYQNDIWTQNLSPNEWLEILKKENYEYIYLYNVDDKFKENYGILFENIDKIDNNCLYKIKDDGKFKLVK